MNLITNFLNVWFKFIFIAILGIAIIDNKAESQDLFGALPSSPTSYVTSTAVSNNGDIFISVWGSGIYKANSDRTVWNPVSTGLTNLNVTHLEFISNNEIMLSTMGGGVFKTSSITNVNWVECNTGLTNLNVRSIKHYPTGMIMIGTYGSGVFISNDKGDSWTESNTGLLYQDVTTIEIADNGWILAGTYGGGIFQSRDTAKTWKVQNSGLDTLFINQIKISPRGYLYAATNGRGVYVSVNDGIAWAELDTFMTRPLKVNPVPLPDLNAVNITFNKTMDPVFGTRYGGIYAEDKQEDYTWVPSSVRGKGVNSIFRADDSMFAFIPNALFYASNDLGDVWKMSQNLQLFEDLTYPHKILSLNEKEIISYHNKTIKKTTDDGATWTILSTVPAQINKIARDSNGYFFAATESGLYASDPTMSDWNLLKCRDTMVLDVEIAASGTKFIATRYLKMEPEQPVIDVRKVWFTRDGTSWEESGILFDAKSSPPHDIGVNYNGVVYLAAGPIIYYSTNDGSHWIPTSSFPFDVTSIGFLRDNTVIVGTRGSGIYRSTTPTTFVRMGHYPATNIETIYTSLDDRIFCSGVNIQLDAAYATYEATYMSLDKGESFININNHFHGESVTSFSVNNKNDLYMATVSGRIYRAISAQNLSTPKLISLENDVNDIDVDAEFVWTSDPRAELYQIEISYNQDFSYIWESATQLDTTHRLLNALYPNHTYYWRVRSKNHEAVSPWSEVRSFTSKLAKPILISPENLSENIPVYAPLIWHSLDGADTFTIQISKSASFDTLTYEWSSSDTISYSDLLEGRTEYFWRVKASNEKSSSDWSEVRSFVTIFGPPNLLSPADDSKGINVNVEFVWSQAIEIDVYDIQIAEDESFESTVFDTSNVKALSIYSTNLEYDKTYYWRVRSRIDDLISEWSHIFKFRTGYSPVVLLTPADESVNVKIMTDFGWEQHESQNIYEFEVAEDVDFGSNVIFETINDELTYTASNLSPYRDYFWRMRVISEENTGIWSESYEFKTKVDKITLRFPNDKSENHPIEVNFLWFSTNGAASYHLQIATDDSFNDLVFSQDTISSISHIFDELNPASIYYWRVRGVTPEGVGDWSDVWQFNTGNNIPILLAPSNGDEEVDLPVNFEWQAVGGATKYEINISQDEDFIELSDSNDDIGTNVYKSTALEHDKTYFWRIRATTNDGLTSWSQVWRFTTKPETSVKIVNLENSEIFPNPSSGNITILIPELIGNGLVLSMMDMAGRNIEDYSAVFSDGMITLDCQSLSNGVYFVKIMSGNIHYTCEVIIQR